MIFSKIHGSPRYNLYGLGRNKFYFVFLLAFSVLSCGGRGPFPGYEAVIPEKEDVNASLYCRELFEARLKKAYESGDDLAVLTNGVRFYKTFLGQDEGGWVSWYFGQSIGRSIQNDSFKKFYESQDKSDKALFKIRISKEDSNAWSYSNEHLSAVLDNRSDYGLEKKIVALLWLPRLQAVESETDFKKNFALIDQIARRYPDTPGAARALDNTVFFPDEWTEHARYKQTWQEAVATIRICANADSEKGEWHALQGDFLRARNRPHTVKSRSLARLGEWEEVEVLGYVGGLTNGNGIPSLQGMNALGAEWAKIRFHNGELGFIETRFLGAANLKPTRQEKRFREIKSIYDRRDYLRTAEEASSFILKNPPQSLKEKAIVLLGEAHQCIAERATSLRSPYYRYVRTHPGFFRYQEAKKEIVVSDLLLRHLVRINPESRLVYSLDSLESP